MPTCSDQAAFFGKTEVAVNGTRVRPFGVTAKLPFPKWKMNESDRDITVMKVMVEGKKGGDRRRYTYDLLDRFDTVSGTHSMHTTSGMLVARALPAGLGASSKMLSNSCASP